MQSYRFHRTEHLSGGRTYNAGDVASADEFTKVELAHLITVGAVNAVSEPEDLADTQEIPVQQGPT